MFKDVFNQHIVGAELVLVTVLGNGGKTKGKGSNRPIRFSLPVLDWLCKIPCPLAGLLRSPKMLGAGLKEGSHFLPHLEREHDVGNTGSCGVIEFHSLVPTLAWSSERQSWSPCPRPGESEGHRMT